MQWRDRLAQMGSRRTMDWPNYFPLDFLASWVAQALLEQYQMSGLEPYASDSRGRLSCTQRSCDICSLHKHWDWMPSVCLCLFLSSLVHKNSTKWVWLSNLLRKSSNFNLVMHFQMLYLQSSHLCVIYRQKSTTVLFVNSKCPWQHDSCHGKVKKLAALTWCTNESKHYFNHINITHPPSWQTPTFVPQEVQVYIIEVFYPYTGLN